MFKKGKDYDVNLSKYTLRSPLSAETKKKIGDANRGRDLSKTKREYKRSTVEGKTRFEWAEHYGVNVSTIGNRLRINGHPHPYKANYNPNAKKIEGKSISEWAEHYGVTTTGIYNRIDRCGHPHPSKVPPNSQVIEGKTRKQWAKHYGVSTQTIHNRIHAFGNPHPPIARRKERKG